MSLAYVGGVKLIDIYKCLCDETRLRILNLLAVSPLCVCHLQSVLGKSQVLISQHLSYLRERSVVESQRQRNWMIYSLPTAPPPELENNLRCLQDCLQTEPVFAEDRQKLQELFGDQDLQTLLSASCCPSPSPLSANTLRNSPPFPHD